MRKQTRREMLQTGGGAALALASTGLLEACGGSDSSTSAGAAGSPRRGGELRVGMISGGRAETLNPAQAYNMPDVARIDQIYDSLYTVAKDLRSVPQLVEEDSVTSDAKEWTFRVRDGVTFHNGQPLTADDVLWTIRTWLDPSHFGYTVGGNIDAAGLKKLDKRTVRVPLKVANARLPNLLAASAYNLAILPDGARPERQPPGTGPFKLKEFVAGERSTMVRYDDYWENGKPYTDSIEIITTFTDDTSRYNALLGDQLDVVPQMSYVQASIAEGNDEVNLLNAKGPACMCFYMEVDKPPFNDSRVRQAMRLLVDRQAMVDTVFHGFGSPANDLFGPGVQFYAEDLQRQPDVEQAKSLLKQAGQENLTVALKIANAFPGCVESGELLQQQAKAAGVTIQLDRVDAGQYFDTSTLYLKMGFAASYFAQTSCLEFPWGLLLQRNSPANETHWRDAKSDRIVAQAMAESDEAKAAELWHQAQEIQFNDGGYIWWGRYNNLDATGSAVGGIPLSAASWCDNFRFLNAWKSA